MTIPPHVSQRELDQAQSRLALSGLVKIFEGTGRFDLDHKQNLLWRFFQTTKIAADSTKAFHEEYRKNYLDALGETTDAFLLAFNATVERYVAAVRAGTQDPEFEYPPEGKEGILTGLNRLKERTSNYAGFFVPYPGMDHPHSNTHLCTGL